MIIRPPSEADSLILQITYGCTHNKCTFCPTYLGVRFGTRPPEEIFEDIADTAEKMKTGYYRPTRRVFLTDGNALALTNRRLLPILEALRKQIPGFARAGIYANAGDVLRKSDDELRELKDAGLGIAYMGLESGSDEILRRVNKGWTVDEMTEAVRRLEEASIKTSVIGLLGLGGRELSKQHAESTGRVAAAMSPTYFSLLTLMVVPGTQLHREYEEGSFSLPDAMELVAEQRIFLESVDGIERTIFRSNHASNYLPLAGVLPRDRDRLVAQVREGEKRGPDSLRPEFLRGL